MANQERGVYQPQEDFASYEDYPEEEGRSRLPLMIAIAIVVLLAFGGVVYLAYNQGVQHGRAGAPPIVAAPAGPARTAPGAGETQTASGTPGTPYTGLKIYGEPVPPDDEAAQSQVAPQATPDVTVATQTPAPSAAPAPPAETQTRLSPAPAAAPAATPAPGVTTAPVLPPSAIVVAHSTPLATHPAPAPTPATSPVLAPATPEVAVATPEQIPAHTPAPAAARPHAAPSTAVTHAPAQITPTPAPAVPDIVPVPAPAQTQVAVATEPPPAQTAPAATPEASAPAVATHTGGAATSGKAVLQIGSYPSKALASSAWTRFKGSHGAALAGLSDDVATANIPGKGTWYRLRVGPFTDRGAAAAKCAQLKAAGLTCIVSAP